ncbi:RNA-dependent RNA polymerase [Rhizoctonia solani]|uniref:RNA-dependent RNA polymerase n=1 Tax=Rhizoctonia solani TaxID=456999 RepID=A0A8H7HD72_9AGAM|nr:RNA-dependent RNA polymerase [Rhizoctonia solani]
MPNSLSDLLKRSQETSKARSQRGLKRITRPLSQQFIRPTLASRIQSAKTEPKTPKRFKLSQEQPWIQSDLLSAIEYISQGKDLGTSAVFTPIESCGPQIKHIEKTPKLGNTLLNDESRFEEPEDVVMTSLADEQLDQLEADSKISFTNHDWNLPKNMHKVAHSPSHQKVFDSLGLPWAVQWEVARLVGAHPELSWDDVPLEALEKLCGSSSESAPRVAEVLFGKHPYYKVINARERTIHPLGSASPWAEYDHEDMLLRINSVERLGCEGTYFGGKIDQVLRLSVHTSGKFEFQLQPPVVSTSCRFRRYLGSRRLIEVRFSEKEPRLKPQVLREYMVENALVINGRVFRAFYARRTIVYLVETNEALDRQEDELVGDQFRRSLRDFIEWHNPLYANPYQTLNKWSSRFALGFSTSRPGLMFAPSEIYYLPETVAPGKSSNSAIMTDGAGFINAAAMNQLTAQMKWSTAPVSVQARFGGSKGLFILHPNDRLLDNPPRIYIRPSQVKVKLHPDPRRWCASHRVLDVLTRNTMAVGTQVTDQVIINLSHNGVPTTILDSMTRTYIESACLIPYVKEGRFLQLWETIFTRSKVQELILKGLTPESMARAQGFKSIEKGQDLLDAKFTYQPDPYSGHPPSFETQALGLLQSGFDLKFTPLFNRIESIQKMILFGMDGKCHLHIPNSAQGFIIPDPLGILDVGEVFCGFGRPVRDNSGTDISTVLGPVLVSRNPCILPSDMRKVIAVECPELWAAGYTDVIVFSVKGERSLASMLAGGDYDGDTAILIWEEALVNQFTNSATHFADVDVSDHFVSNPKRMEEIPPDDFRSVLNALLAPLMPNQVGMYGNWHMTAAKVLGLDDPETVRLGNVFTTCLDGVKTGLTILPQFLQKDSRKWNNVDPRIVSKLSVIEDLKQALDVYRQKCENEIVALRPYRRYDPDLLEPYNRERELCTRIPELSRELDQIVAFVNKMKEEFDKGEFSIGKRHGPASFDRKTEPGKKYSRRQRQESEWAASEAYNTGLPKGLLHIRDEMVPRIAASYAYSQDQDCSPGFAFAVAWSQLCKIKAEKKGPITAMDPQFGSLMCISKRTRQQLDLIAQ